MPNIIFIITGIALTVTFFVQPLDGVPVFAEHDPKTHKPKLFQTISPNDFPSTIPEKQFRFVGGFFVNITVAEKTCTNFESELATIVDTFEAARIDQNVPSGVCV
jgi:hypothetical protein